MALNFSGEFLFPANIMESKGSLIPVCRDTFFWDTPKSFKEPWRIRLFFISSNVNLFTMKGLYSISETYVKHFFHITELREKRKGRGSKPSVIAIHPELLEFMASRAKESLPGAFVFLNPRTGEPYSQSGMFLLWERVRKTAGVDLRLYDATRHSFASQLVNAGTSIFKVSKMLGHSSTRMTEKYSHADLASLRIDLEKVSLKKIVRLTGSEPEVQQGKVKNAKRN